MTRRDSGPGSGPGPAGPGSYSAGSYAAPGESDPSSLLFGDDPADGYGSDGYGSDGYGSDGYGSDGFGSDGYRSDGYDGYGDDGDDRPRLSRGGSRQRRETRADRRRTEHARSRRRSRRGALVVVLTVALIVAVVVVLVPKVFDYFSTPDYSGAGSGSISVTIPTGASATDIGSLLSDKGVVKSAKAFTDAADDNSDSDSIQPGTYTLRLRMSGAAAVTALLDPSTRLAGGDILVIEGATSRTVSARLVQLYGADHAAEVTNALAAPGSLSIPSTYKTTAGKAPSSVEGFLFPATYSFDPSQSPTDTLTKMVLRFVQQDRDTEFAGDARSAGFTPYQALIVASMVQGEAKYTQDMPKVVEVIKNRLRAKMPLQIDATTRYGCLLAGTVHCNFSQDPNPYNSYLNNGLPPTPIDNPGATAMSAAVHPATGKYLYYVNGDAQGHLAFFTNAADWNKAREKCAENNWGCA